MRLVLSPYPSKLRLRVVQVQAAETVMRTGPGAVPDIATLLLGPISRGPEVSVR